MKNVKRQQFGVILARAMKAKGINQTELAEKSGVRQSAISMLLRGCRHPTLATAGKVADALNIKVDALR